MKTNLTFYEALEVSRRIAFPESTELQTVWYWRGSDFTLVTGTELREDCVETGRDCAVHEDTGDIYTAYKPGDEDAHDAEDRIPLLELIKPGKVIPCAPLDELSEYLDGRQEGDYSDTPGDPMEMYDFIQWIHDTYCPGAYSGFNYFQPGEVIFNQMDYEPACRPVGSDPSDSPI